MTEPMDPAHILGVEPEATLAALAVHDVEACNRDRERTRRSLAEARRLRDQLGADLDAEQAAHEEHRRSLADALRVNPGRLRDWDETIKAARDIAKLREDNQLRAEKAEADRAQTISGMETVVRRARRAEAKLARVRDELTQCHGWGEDGDGYYRAIRAALGDDQPAEANSLSSRLCRMLGLEQGTSDDELIEAVRWLLVREVWRGQPAATDPCAHGCRAAADQLAALDQETEGEPPQATVPLHGPIEAAAELLLTAARALRNAITPQDRV